MNKASVLSWKALVTSALLAFVAGNAAAVSLQQAYEAALKNDPQYRMNYYENESAKENVIIGRSNLLPQVSASVTANRNIADRYQCCTREGDRVFDQPRYISRSSVIQVRQPILNLDGIVRYRQGKVQTQQGSKKFESDTNEVILRVVGAYADALFAEDQVELSKVQRDMYLEQMKVNNRLFEKGEGTKTDMLETQARLDLAEAQLVEAQNNAVAQRNTLAGIIGMDPGTLDKLGENFHFQDLPLKSFDDWRTTALERNPLLAAGRLAIENARLEVQRDKAGHLPRLDLVASYGKDESATLTSFNQDVLNRAVGVQLNIPIYQGGAISATTRQAAANLERTRADLDNRSNQIMVELRKSFDLVQNSVAKIKALERAVASGKELMTATEQSIKGGVRINLDLLNAQQQLYTSQRDLAQARYAYLIGLLRLRADAGTLDESSVREVAAYFR
ncbi:TolC family outer membrane protein [Massilia sp. YIM B02763]|uniref:TolC family outer membrane protein n=1 Tax=Massilia sp. YIM B02763 TaxID=3050130 RepID=UPI0025B732BF|nr:TolC family outer membrane protein [Massilia sp. YIM B02763]MDN4054636.1 TolC family outer membrane protein [Massilia sp. YIM B02763]